MEGLTADVRHSLRTLRRSPAFALIALTTLALGIGANTAIFSMVNGVLLRPLPFPEPDRLYAVYSANKTAGLLEASVSAVDLDDWRAQRQVIEDIGGYFYAEGSSGVDLTGRGAPRRLAGVYITPGFFTALGVQPARGRLPREDELVRGGPDRVAVLTHGFWVREFGADPLAIGSTISLGGTPYSVIGVLAPDMRFPTDTADVYLPFSNIPDSGIPRLRQVRVLRVVARAKPGVTEDSVRAEMMTITGRLSKQYAEDRAWDGATVSPLADVIVGPARQGLLVLFGAVGLVLLMACVNVAGLQLARAMGRGREVAVRLALGARRGRLVRQLLTESLVLSAIGGVLGLILAKAGLVGLLALSAGQLPRAAEVSTGQSWPLRLGCRF
jgi:predicted permease